MIVLRGNEMFDLLALLLDKAVESIAEKKGSITTEEINYRFFFCLEI